MKISEMYKKAQTELTQCKSNLYVENDGHCALGVLLHYIYGHEACERSVYTSISDEYMRLEHNRRIRRFDAALGKRGTPLSAIYDRNDSSKWSFKTFEKAARKLGL